MAESSEQRFIAAFFSALQARDANLCASLLAELQAYGQKHPESNVWHDYLQGIYRLEFEHNSSAAEAIFKQLLQNLRPDLFIRIWNSLGITYRRQGRWQESREIYEQYLKTFNQSDQQIALAKVQKNLATVLEIGFTQGQFGIDVLYQAIDHCHSALSVLQAIDAPNDEAIWLESLTWNTLGAVYLDLQNWSKAQQCFERHLAISQVTDNSYYAGIALNNLGQIYELQDEWPKAKQTYLEAQEIFRAFGDEYEQIDVLSNLGSVCHKMREQAQSLVYYDEAIIKIESLRAGVTEEKRRRDFFAITINTFAQAVCLAIEMKKFKIAFDYVERARSRTFLDSLAADSPYLQQGAVEKILSLDKIQANLPPDALILSYFTMGQTDGKKLSQVDGFTPYRHRKPPEKIYLFAVTRDHIAVIDLELSPNEVRWRQIERFFKRGIRPRYFYEKLIEPIKERLVSIRRLYIVPHGPLHYIPFQALMTNEGSFLFDHGDIQITYAPSATILARHCRSARDLKLAPFLALGYNGPEDNPLQFAEAEAKSIARRWEGDAKIGPGLKKETLFERGRQAQCLHISCHGEFVPTEPMASFLHLGLHEKLTAQEIMDQLRLEAQLVTLSACESGVSRVLQGDEPMGLMRAFIIAGTPTVVCSLWNIGDYPTYILMDKFYEVLQKGIHPALALKQAQQHLRQFTRADLMTMISTYKEIIPFKGAQDHLLQGDPQEKIFDTPYFWSAMILIGGFEQLETLATRPK